MRKHLERWRGGTRWRTGIETNNVPRPGGGRVAALGTDPYHHTFCPGLKQGFDVGSLRLTRSGCLEVAFGSQSDGNCANFARRLDT